MKTNLWSERKKSSLDASKWQPNPRLKSSTTLQNLNVSSRKKILKIVRLHGDYFQKVAAMVFYACCAWRFKKSIWCVSPTSRLCVPFMLSKSPATPYVMEKKKSHGAYHSWIWVVEIKWCLLLLECVAAVFGESSCIPWRL